MKTLSKYGLSAIIGICIVLGIFAFVFINPQQTHHNNSDQEANAPIVIPELLVRPDGLKQTAEWETNVHRVSELSSKLIAHPNDAEALIGLCQVFCVEARVTGEHGYYYPTILTMLDRALSQPDLSDKIRFEGTALKANVLLAQHRWNDGLAAAQEAHDMNPYSAQVYSALIDANVELGHYADAVHLTDEMMEIKPGLMAYARASYLRELHGDIDGAIEAMALAADAGYPGYENTEWCRMHLAELLERQGRFEEAENVYMLSLDYRENNPFAIAGIAGIRTEQGRYAEAETMLKKALAEVPEIAFQEDLFVLYKKMGRLEEAEAAYDEIIAMVEDDAAHGHKVDLDYAKILLDFGNNPDAALEKALKEYKVRPDNIQLNGLLARIYAAQGKTDLARTYLSKATVTGYTDASLEELKEQLS